MATRFGFLNNRWLKYKIAGFRGERNCTELPQSERFARWCAGLARIGARGVGYLIDDDEVMGFFHVGQRQRLNAVEAPAQQINSAGSIADFLSRCRAFHGDAASANLRQ